MSDVFHMNTDLVGAPGFETDFQKGGVRPGLIGEQPVMGDCGFPMYRVRDACNGRSWEPGYGNVNGSFRLIRKISDRKSVV